MKSPAFPLIVDLARESRSAVGADAVLTAAQRDAQDELRSQFPKAPGGTLLPWYERRDLTATGTTTTTGDQGGMTVGTGVPEIGAALRDRLVLERLGARVFGGLRSDVRFPRAKAEVSAEWLSENAAATESTFTFASLSLAPKRVTAFVDVSWQLLLQQRAAEPFIRAELTAALATAVQEKLINGSGSGGEPTGILNTTGIGDVAGGTDGAAPDYADLCDLEFAVTGTAKADRGNLAWLVSPLVRKKLRQTEAIASSGRPIWPETEAERLLGHAAGVTPSVPDDLDKGTSVGVCSAIVFAEMSEVIIAFWGPGIAVEAVPHGGHLNGMTRLFATAYVDGGLRTPAAAAAMKDALAA